MKKNKSIIFIFLFLFVILIVSCSSKNKSLLENGLVDLKNSNFFEVKKIALSGKWYTYDNEVDFISSRQNENTKYIKMPNLKEEIIGEGSQVPLMLSVKVESLIPGEKYSLKIPYIYGNYKLYVNGRMITYQYRGEDSLYTQSKYVEFHNEEEDAKIMLQIFPVKNFNPGFRQNIVLGIKKDLMFIRDFSIILNFMVITLLLISIFYYFYIMHKDLAKDYIRYIILASGCGIIFQIVNFEFFEMAYTFREKFKHIILLFGVYFLLNFFIRFFEIKSNKANNKFVKKSILILVFMSIILPYRLHMFWKLTEWIIIGLFLYTMLLNILSYIKQKKNSLINLLSYLFILMVAIIYASEDMGQAFLNIGVFFFVLSQFFIFLRKNYSMEKDNGEAITYNYEMMRHIEYLKENLEIKVRERTKKLEQKNNMLEKMAITDSLTTLYNHKYVYDTLDAEYKKAIRYKKPLSVIMIDIDYFKKINDTYGHQIGDEILVNVSKLLKGLVRETDVLGRYGGEEFAVVLCETDIEGAYTLAERIRMCIGSKKYTKENIAITISAGVSQLDKEQDAKELINAADKLLYKAKKSGRNRVEI